MPSRLDSYRLLGRSGLRVSPLALGTMTFGTGGGFGSTDDDAEKIVRHYVDQGGNFIDTADFYGRGGGSERLLAPLIADRRDSLVVSTKYSLTTRAGDPNASGNHRKNMVRSVEDSLTRLGTDYIDLLHLHVWDYRTPPEEIMRAFDDLVRTGRVLYVGLSDTPAWECARMQTIADLRGWSPAVALQVPYNLTERTVEREQLPMARATGMGVLPWSPLAGGVLSGKYKPEDLGSGSSAQAGTRHSVNLATGRLNDRNMAIAAEVAAVATELGHTSSQVALAWTMLNPAVVAPLVGARTVSQLEDNLGALDVEFAADHVERLDAVSRIDLGFPHEQARKPEHAMMFGNVDVELRS